MITLLLLIPVLGSLLLLPISDETIKGQRQMKKIALTTSLINFFISLFVWYQFDSNTSQFQFVSEYHQLSFCHLNFGIDGVSIYFVLLTTIITPVALLSNWNSIQENVRSYVIIILLLETLLLAVFLVLDLLMFYIFFESILPPLFILIGLYGSNNKVRASFYLFLYTLFSKVRQGLYPYLISVCNNQTRGKS